MKHLTMLLYTVLATLWAISASAVDFDQHNRSRISFSIDPSQLWPEALWNVETDDELNLFDGAEWHLEVRLTNAIFPSATGDLAINTYNEAGVLLEQFDDFDYTVDSAGPWYVFKIRSNHIGFVNFLINNIDIIVPGTVRFGLMPLADANAINCNRPVVMEAAQAYDDTLIAFDTLTLPFAIGCP